MRQIIKTELIYYNAPKDFEFEFNLGGACQMRLLTAFPESRKDLVLSLSKAVTRSKILLIITQIDDVFINTIAAAIRFEKEPIDFQKFGIKSSSIKEIIKGAVPLVTDAGRLGGFIIECGMQSLVVITKEKTIRNELMNKFVYQYIKDVNNYEPEINNSTQSDENIPEADNEQDIEPFVAEIAPENTAEITDNASDDATDDLSEEPSESLDEEEIKAEETAGNDIDIEIDDFDDEFDEETENTTIHFPDLPVYIMDDSNIDKDDFQELANDYEISENEPTKTRQPLSTTTIFFLIVLCFLLILVSYLFIIDPILNGITIADNFSYYWKILFG